MEGWREYKEVKLWSLIMLISYCHHIANNSNTNEGKLKLCVLV